MLQREVALGKVKPSHAKSASLDLTIELDHLRQLATLGTGTFGRVKLVQHRKTGKVMALKAMMKAHIVKSHQQKNVMNEKNIMVECRHPFVLQLVSQKIFVWCNLLSFLYVLTLRCYVDVYAE